MDGKCYCCWEDDADVRATEELPICCYCEDLKNEDNRGTETS